MNIYLLLSSTHFVGEKRIVVIQSYRTTTMRFDVYHCRLDVILTRMLSNKTKNPVKNNQAECEI